MNPHSEGRMKTILAADEMAPALPNGNAAP